VDVAVVGQALQGLADVDELVGVDGRVAHHLLEVEPGLDALAAVHVQGLRGLEVDDVAQLLDALVLALHEVVAAAGVLGVDVGAAEVLGGHGLADGGLDHGGAGQEREGQLLDHDGLRGQVDDVGAARRVAARGERVLADAHGGHAAHVVEHAPEMAVIGEAAQLQGQVDAAGVGDVDAGQPQALCDGLGPHVLLQGDGEVGSRSVAVLVGEDHAVAALDRADARHQAAAGDVAALLGLVDLAAVELDLADVVARIDPDLEELRAGVDELLDEVAHGLLALLGEARHLFRPANVVGLFAVLHQFGILRLPVLQVALPFRCKPLGPRHFLLFCHMTPPLSLNRTTDVECL